MKQKKKANNEWRTGNEVQVHEIKMSRLPWQIAGANINQHTNNWNH